jgi:hypothetical protein
VVEIENITFRRKMLCALNLDLEKIIGNLINVKFKRNFSQKQPN